MRSLLRTVPLCDPWKRYAFAVPTHLYGLGAEEDFTWYFEGESRVQVQTLAEVVDWLRGCTYAHDDTVFQTEDYWQHPLTFERFRVGDCEDFALWAWRKLTRLGYDAEFVAGHSQVSSCHRSGHAWVHVSDGATTYLLDGIMPCHHTALQPLETLREDYLPEVSIDGSLQRYAYAGYFQRLRAAS